MSRAAFGGQPDQQGRLQDQAAALDQSTLDEFDSVLEVAALASQDSSAGDSAVRSISPSLDSDTTHRPIRNLILPPPHPFLVFVHS